MAQQSRKEKKCRKSAYERALDLASRRDYTTGEIGRKLVQNGYNPDEIPAVLERLIEIGLLDDVRYVELYVLQRLAASYGPRYITEKLYAKGIERQMSEAAIEQHIIAEDISLEDNAFQWIEKLNLDNQKERDKALRRLIARGYDYQLARHVITSST